MKALRKPLSGIRGILENEMKRTKQDKQFMIQFDQNNRNFLINVSMFIMSFIISMVSLLISVLAVIIALDGITLYLVVVALIFGLIIISMIVLLYPKIKNNNKNSFKINKQLQEGLFKTYPEYKNKYY